MSGVAAPDIHAEPLKDGRDYSSGTEILMRL
jgi:hypothetical protein